MPEQSKNTRIDNPMPSTKKMGMPSMGSAPMSKAPRRGTGSMPRR